MMKSKLFKLLFPTLYVLYGRMLSELEEYSEYIGGCDHSVGICQCDLDRLIEEARGQL